MFTNLDHRFWIINIVKFISGSGNDSPGFTKDMNSSRNPQGVRYQVGTGVEEDYFASEKLQKPSEISEKGVRESSDEPYRKPLVRLQYHLYGRRPWPHSP